MNTSNSTTTARRVLIVDDNVDAAESLKLLLELTGHVAMTAYRGAAAVDAVPEFKPDLVLLDLGLPDMDGCEVARRLRAQYGRDCPRLVALSGWSQAEDKHRAAAAGIDDHFTKPVDPTMLSRLFEP